MNRARTEGMALLLALLFVALLSAIVLEFAYEAQVEGAYVEHSTSELQARLAAQSAIARGISLLAVDVDEAMDAGSPLFDSLQDVWAQGIPYESLNDAVMQCSIDDECGKINLNALVDPETGEVNTLVEEALRSLFNNREVEEDPVDAIIDWLDADEDALTNGAENDYYESLDVPYTCKNGAFDSLEELLLVRGITPEIFWGNPDEEQLPLTEILTVHGDPAGRINVNTAEQETLDAVGEAVGMGALADIVIPEREANPYTDAGELQSRGIVAAQPGLTSHTKQKGQNTPSAQTAQDASGATALAPQDMRGNAFRVDSEVFRIYGHGLCGNTVVRVEAYVWRDTAGVGDEAFRMLDWRVVQ